MKLLFSETTPDYANYLYPYAVWGYLEPGETPADAFAAGFLPGLPSLDRFYLVRHLRVPLPGWAPSSENRRILRKGTGWDCTLVPKASFEYAGERRDRWLSYAAERFGEGVMPGERLDRVMAGPVVSHVLHFTEPSTGRELGSAVMYLEPPRVAYYYYAFYDLALADRNLGMFMMTRAVEHFASLGYAHLYIGTCVTPKALYKAQFEPLEFFNGNRWSRDAAELKHLVQTGCPPGKHRLETPDFLAFQPGGLAGLVAASPFRVGRSEV
ncbi:MAG: hypothetical protein DVB31_15440 [Verrucomicrobia bacterium]|nr:MAG: hypothetical protein DVB31_15440 [Verrucomicrobiota bacterium]